MHYVSVNTLNIVLSAKKQQLLRSSKDEKYDKIPWDADGEMLGFITDLFFYFNINHLMVASNFDQVPTLLHLIRNNGLV